MSEPASASVNEKAAIFSLDVKVGSYFIFNSSEPAIKIAFVSID
ncbi:MAG: hypothetical protein ACUVRG_10075 [Ignavibacterium sp.]